MSKIKIVADSSSDVLTLSGVDFESAPLKIITDGREYVDDPMLDVEEMAEYMLSYKGRSSTSCPNVEDWIAAFGEAEEIFCITITGQLSGSYASACNAKRIYEEEHIGRRVAVIDSLSTGPEMALMIDKIAQMINEDKSFDEICEYIKTYSTELIFVLESMKNLANNGRVSPIVAKLAGMLGIRIVGRASDEGTLEVMHKCKGELKMLETVLSSMKALGFKGGKVKIAHCMNEAVAEKLKELLAESFEKIKIEIYQCRGLCSFYAEKGGVLVGFET